MLPKARGVTGLKNDAGLRDFTFTLAAGQSFAPEVKGLALFIDQGPTTSGVLGLRLAEDDPEFEVKVGHYMHGRKFVRLFFRNKSAAPVTVHVLVTENPEFLALQPGGGSGAGLSDATLWDSLAHGNYRFYPFSSVPTLLHSSGGGSTALTGPELAIDSGAGAFKDRWVGERDPLNLLDENQSVPTAWNRQHRHRCLVMLQQMIGGTVDSWIGIGLGAYNVVPPYPVGVSAAVVNCALLYANGGTNTWELYVGRQAAKSAKLTLAGVGIPTFNAFQTYALEVRYFPGSRVEAYVDGVLGATQSDLTVLPDPAFFMDPIASLFVTTGNNAGADSTGSYMADMAAMFGFPGLV